jgi:hypothetical protein
VGELVVAVLEAVLEAPLAPVLMSCPRSATNVTWPIEVTLTTIASSALPSAERRMHVYVPAVGPVLGVQVVVVFPVAGWMVCSNAVSWEDNS